MRFFWLAFVFFACADASVTSFSDRCDLFIGEDTGTPTPTYDSTLSDTGAPFTTSPLAPSNGPITQLSVALHFGVDDSGRVRSVEVSGAVQRPVFAVLLGDDSWSGGLADFQHYCTLSYYLDGRSTAPTTEGSGTWFALDGLDLDNATTDCEAFDPGYTSHFIKYFGDRAWNFRLGGPLDDAFTALGADAATSYGGQISSDLTGEIDVAAMTYEVNGRSLAVDEHGRAMALPAKNNEAGYVRATPLAPIAL